MIGRVVAVLGTMLAKTGRWVSIVDIDKEPFVLAKRHLGFPRMVECFVDYGLIFLQKARRWFDAIIVDAFVGEKIPPQFSEQDVFSAIERILRKLRWVSGYWIVQGVNATRSFWPGK
jgi:spermidine synthase